jgi:hypothetical protein
MLAELTLSELTGLARLRPFSHQIRAQSVADAGELVVEKTQYIGFSLFISP